MAFAVALTIALFMTLGPKRTRLVAQVMAAVIGAACVIGLQLAAIQSLGSLSRTEILGSSALVALAPESGSILYWPARAAVGDLTALAGVLGFSVLLLGAAIALFAPRFGDCALAAGGVSQAATRRLIDLKRLPAGDAAARLAAEGMAAAAARPLAGVAEPDADPLSRPARLPALARMRRRRRRRRRAGAGAGHGGGTARRRARMACDLGRGRARTGRDRAGLRRGRSCAPRSKRSWAPSVSCSCRSSRPSR